MKKQKHQEYQQGFPDFVLVFIENCANKTPQKILDMLHSLTTLQSRNWKPFQKVGVSKIINPPAIPRQLSLAWIVASISWN